MTLRLFVMLAGVTLVATAQLAAQTVTAVAGKRVTISAGERQGVHVDMTGTLCRQQKIGSRSVEVCPATFRVVSVARESATAVVTRGETAQVQEGLRATFDQRLVREETKPKASRPHEQSRDVQPRPADPEALLADAELSFDKGDGAAAIDLYRRLLRMVPEDEYVTRRAADAARLPQRSRPTAKKPTREETALAKDLAAASRSGRTDVEQAMARKLLEVDPASAPALAVRSRARAAAWTRARGALSRWAAVAAWQDALALFPEDAVAQTELRFQIEGLVNELAHPSEASCGMVAAKVSAFPPPVRSAKWFRTALTQASASWTCPFVGIPDQTGTAELTLVVVTLRQQKPLPGMTASMSVLGGSKTVQRALFGKEAKCSEAVPCNHDFLVAAGEQYQIALTGGSFRSRTDPVTVVGPPAPASLCITQKMTRLAITPCR